jgi:SAM-dependent methyltransferase
MVGKEIQADEIRSAVRQQYGQIARDLGGSAVGCGCGCGPNNGTGGIDAQAIYETPDVTAHPSEVIGLSLGCGDPVTLASLEPGQTVLDLGSGGGIDCFLAAKAVGPSGRIIGVDMTAEMIERARANARTMGAENVEFRLGEIEHLPVADEAVDVVISNCVINLSPDKPQVFREAYRVLRPGGRLAVSDIVTRAELAPEIRQDLSSWAGCVAGATIDEDYVAAVEAAGFVDVTIEEKTIDDEGTATQLGLENGPTTQAVIYSARVTAIKP